MSQAQLTNKNYMDALLTTHRYRPAAAHPLALERAYLRNFFAGAFDVPLVILEADSGYGKTTTLSSVAQREGLAARWLTLADIDGDLNFFVHDLLQALYHRSIPQESAPLNTRRALDLILGALRELSVSALILDNFDAVVRAEPINGLLEQLIDELPPFTRIMVATKKTPALRRGSRQRNRSAVLSQQDLRFDVDDVSQYFIKVHNYHLSAEDAAFIIDRTQGKPLLINLLGQLTRNLPSYLKIDWRCLPIGPEQERIKLLLREVITKLPRVLAHAAHKLGSVQAIASDSNTAVGDLLDTLAERHCLVQQYCYDGADSAINVPHEILVELSALI